MNKIMLCILLCVGIMGNPLQCVAINWREGTSAETAMNNLEILDIVRNPEERWTKESYITRREAMQMAYIVKNLPGYTLTGAQNRRQYSKLGENQERMYQLFVEQLAKDNHNIDFIDLDPTKNDYELAVSLIEVALLAGKEKEGELYAGFDDEMTYNEALATVIRMIKPRTSGFIALPYTPPAGGSFLELAEILELTSTNIEEPFKAEIGNYLNWMNGGITKDEAGIIYVSDDMLDTKIRAYEYMRLFYRALFVETQFQDDYPDVTGRLIDQLLRDLGEKFTDVHEDIVI